METMRNNSGEELNDFNQEIKIYQSKMRIKIMISSISFIVLSFGLFFNNNIYRVNEPVVYLILALLLIIIVMEFLFMYFIKKSKTLEFSRKKKDLLLLHKIHNIVYIIVNVMFLVIVFQLFVISSGTVSQTSMEPGFYEGDRILVNHFNVQYKRHDVVILDVYNNQDYLMKRIIGLPGETVTIKDGMVYIDGEVLDEVLYLNEEVYTYCSVQGIVDINIECTWTMSENEYFVLGDNRVVSLDSRSFGLISKADLIGEVIFNLSK